MLYNQRAITQNVRQQKTVLTCLNILIVQLRDQETLFVRKSKSKNNKIKLRLKNKHYVITSNDKGSIVLQTTFLHL